MKKNILKKLSLVLALCSIFALFSSFSIYTCTTMVQTSKITDELQSKITSISANEKIPIYIWFNQVDKIAIESAIIQAGWNYEAYLNDELYESQIKPNIIHSATEKYEMQTAKLSTSTHPQNLSQERTLQEYIEEAELSDRNKFNQARLNIINNLQTSANIAFIDDLQLYENDILFQSSYLPYIILNADASLIKNLSSNAEIKEIGLSDMNCKALPTMSIDENSSNQAKMKMSETSSGYRDGTGIKIGIIEAIDPNSTNTQYYDGLNPNSPHLSSAISSGRINWINNIETNPNGTYMGTSNHATFVTSIIGGSSVTVNNVTYRGVVPNSTIYVTNSYDAKAFYNALEILADQSVNVINISLRFGKTSYSEIDYYLDEFINTTGIPVVCAAGNSDSDITGCHITSPAHAYNCITVGNADLSGSIIAPFPVNSSSSYVQTNCAKETNKPDIVAAGTHITYATSQSTTYRGSGTSYAAPYITGTVARMIQAKSAIAFHPEAIKACLLAAANGNRISDDTYRTSNNTDSGETLLLGNKSGAGLVNAEKSVWTSLFQNWTTIEKTIKCTTNYTNIATITPGSSCVERVVLCFNKITNLDSDGKYGINIDARIINNSTGGVVASASSLYNNVEILEFEPELNTTYTIQYKVTSYISYGITLSEAHTIGVAWMQRYERDNQ